jgi:hypothetical protein
VQGRGVMWIWKDLRFAFRQCRHRPGFALAIVSTLAVVVGANIAVFSLVNAVLLRVLPFESPERLVWVASIRPDNPQAPFTLPEFITTGARLVRSRGSPRTPTGVPASC